MVQVGSKMQFFSSVAVIVNRNPSNFFRPSKWLGERDPLFQRMLIQVKLCNLIEAYRPDTEFLVDITRMLTYSEALSDLGINLELLSFGTSGGVYVFTNIFS